MPLIYTAGKKGQDRDQPIEAGLTHLQKFLKLAKPYLKVMGSELH
jgi:hypothetical protein